ncbi:unnamed protein product [Strongylus vulgaris]|uniref:Uncharacterized protein n=1 Tax=Strongylus vulgaris TaxID=40348 RepID=A0A3P7JL59_STRVU|nr:unnamed protein product [Strongylus vulgaris]
MAEEAAKKFGSLATLEAVKAIQESTNVMASDRKGERMEVDPIESQHEAELLAEFERRRRARTLTLPTDDVQGFVEKPDEETTTWYHRGPMALRAARVAIADFSLRRAKER